MQTLPQLVAPVSVSIGGSPAQITYAGPSPGMVDGVLQIDAIIPKNTPGGPQSVIVTVGEDGFNALSEGECAQYARQVVAGRMTLPDGPSAPLRSVS